MAVTQEIIFKAYTDQPVKSVKDLRANIIKYRDDLVQADKESKKYKTAVIELAKAQDELNNITTLARNSTGGLSTIFTNTANAASSLAGGLSAAQGVINLVSSDSSALNKVFVQLQSTLAIFNGLKGLAGLPKSFKALQTSIKTTTASVKIFNQTLKANIILYVVGALVAFASILGTVGNLLANNRSGVDELKRSKDDYLASLERVNRENRHELELMRARGESSDAIILKDAEQTRALKESSDKRIDFLRAEIAAINARNKGWFRGNRKRLKELESQLDEELELNDTFHSRQIELNNQYEVEIVRQRTSHNNNLKNLAKQAAAEQKRIKEQELKDIAAIQKRISEVELDEYAVRIKNLKETYNQQIELLKKYGDEYIDVITALERNLNTEIAKINSTEAKDNYDKEIQKRKDFNDQILAMYDNTILEIESRLSSANLDLLQAGDDQERQEELKARIKEIEEELREAQQIQAEVNIGFYENYRNILLDILEDETIIGDERLAYKTEFNQVELTLQNLQTQNLKDQTDIRIALVQEEIEALRVQEEEEDKLLKKRIANNSAFANAFSGILGSSLNIIKEKTEAYKPIARAQAYIDTFVAANQVLANKETPWYVKIPAMAGIITAGLANVYKINTTSTASKSTTTSTPTYKSVAAIPDVTDVYEPTATPYVRELQNTEERELNARVWISETDLQNSDNRVKINSRDTFM